MLAAGCYAQLGVDVADVRPQDDVERYFGLMQPQFTPEEWQRIRARPTLDLQMVRDARLFSLSPRTHPHTMLIPFVQPRGRHPLQLEFYRYWSLKESYIKATGDGIGFGLQRLSFFSAPELLTHTVTADDNRQDPASPR